MKTVKQILEAYNPYSDISESDKIKSAVDEGLLDEKKIPVLKRALRKEAREITPVEKKVLNESIEALAEMNYLSKFDKRQSAGFAKGEKDAPAVLILKRKAIRIYPDNQKVALYYSDAIDKYFSIPFGMGSPENISLAESKENVEKRKREVPKELDLFRTAISVRRQMKGGKPSSQKLTPSTENIKDVVASARETAKKITKKVKKKQGQYDKAIAKLRRDSKKKEILKKREERWAKEAELPKEKKEPIKVPGPQPISKTPVYPGPLPISSMRNQTKPDKTFPVKSIISKLFSKLPSKQKKLFEESKMADQTIKSNFKDKLKRNREERHQLDEALPLAVPAIAAAGARLAPMAMRAAQAAAPVAKRIVQGVASKAKDLAGKAKDALTKKPTPDKGVKNTRRKKDEKSTADRRLASRKKRIAAELGLGLGSKDSQGKNDSKDIFDFKPLTPGSFSMNPKERVSASQQSVGSRATDAFQQQQNKRIFGESTNLNHIRVLADSKNKSSQITIGESTTTINSRVAKKIMRVYDSLNEENKKKVENMLNEDITSFKKLINFAIKA